MVIISRNMIKKSKEVMAYIKILNIKYSILSILNYVVETIFAICSILYKKFIESTFMIYHSHHTLLEKKNFHKIYIDFIIHRLFTKRKCKNKKHV